MKVSYYVKKSEGIANGGSGLAYTVIWRVNGKIIRKAFTGSLERVKELMRS